DLQRLADQIGISDATQLPGPALPHKIREALWAAQRGNYLVQVQDWLGTLRPEQPLQRPRIRQRRSRASRSRDTGRRQKP
ncbi:MAG: hypothetical protein ACK2UY_07490, partial [Anaerolineae bacterium]